MLFYKHVHRPAVIEEVDELDYDPGSTRESTSHEDTSQDTDKLIVSESVKEVRPCVAKYIDNDHRCEIAVQCIISGLYFLAIYIVRDDICGGWSQMRGLNRGTPPVKGENVTYTTPYLGNGAVCGNNLKFGSLLHQNG